MKYTTGKWSPFGPAESPKLPKLVDIVLIREHYYAQINIDKSLIIKDFTDGMYDTWMHGKYEDRLLIAGIVGGMLNMELRIRKPLESTAPGMFEFLKDENVIPYNPSEHTGLNEIVNIAKEVFK